MRLRAEQLQKHLQRNTLAPLYLVSGEEPLQQGEAVDAIRACARSNGYDERVVFEVDKNFDWNRLLQESDSLSLFSSRKIIELRLGTGKPGREGGPFLIDYAARASADNLLIISCGKLDKRSQSTKWHKALDKTGVTLQIWPVDAGQLPAWIQQRCRSRGKRIDNAGAELIAQRVEGNLMAADQEINKLILLVRGDDIGIEDVMAAVVDSARYDVFAMMEAAFQGDLARTTRMLYGFRNEGVDPMAIYGAVMWNFRQLAELGHRLARGESAETALPGQWGSSSRRKAALKNALSRHRPDFLQNLLVTAGKIDRIIKGDARPLTWNCFHELLRLLAEDGAARKPDLINALAG
jgi:DNA polymerase-3 subunit delta